MPRNKKHNNNKKKNESVEIHEDDLDRFAGSSDEEQDKKNSSGVVAAKRSVEHLDADMEDNDKLDEDSDFPDVEDQAETIPGSNVAASVADKISSDDDDNEEQIVAHPEEDALLDPSAKMANAMSKILGLAAPMTKKNQASVVLGKTVTPLQRMQQKERKQHTAMKEKRAVNRERNLTALHIPLSVATANDINTNTMSVTKELEQERLHRRVATRGVVALFNAIAQHQKTDHQEVASSRSKRHDEQRLTKHGFLDKLKEGAVSNTDGNIEHHSTEKVDQNNSNGKWDALKEDYMLDSKKNWDQESSDDACNFDDDNEENGNDKQETQVDPAPSKKRRRIASSTQ